MSESNRVRWGIYKIERRYKYGTREVRRISKHYGEVPNTGIIRRPTE